MARKPALWTALAVALVAGGVTAAVVLATRGGETSGQVTTEGRSSTGVSDHHDDEDEVSRVYVIQLRRGRIEAVTHDHGNGAVVAAPAWSPDGTRLAFARAACHGCSMNIWVVEVGRGHRPVDLGPGFNPDWSPDGRKLVFVGPRGGLYTMRADGSARGRILPARVSYDEPAWSPSGRLAFLKQEPNGAWHVYTATPDGRDVHRLTRGRPSEVNPEWSPDGKYLAFARQVKLRWQLYVVGANGGRGRPIVREASSDTSPTWSPDGSRVAFVRQTLNRLTISIAPVRGGRPVPVPGTASRPAQPAWAPNGDRIAFTETAGGD